MLVTIRKGSKKQWGLLETFKKYEYKGTGTVKALVCVNRDGTLVTPYIHRNNEFIELSEIEKEMGIAKYIAAKKPFYSMLSDGFVVLLTASVDYTTGEYIESKSSFELYVLNGDLPKDTDKGVMFKKLVKVPEEFIPMMVEPMRVLGESLGSREEFLRRRL